MTKPSKLRRWCKRCVMILMVLLVAIQFVPYGRAQTNPGAEGEPSWDSPRTRDLFMKVCGDCHSHTTRWPWYAKLAPVSWLVTHDVEEAREHFNVSTWDRSHGDADEAVEEYEEGEMPLWFYTPLHPEARLSEEDRSALLEGMRRTFGER